MIQHLDFWIDSDKKVVLDSLTSNIQTRSFDSLRTHLSSQGLTVLSADIAWLEIKDAGFDVVKVIIPELHPLYLDERLKCLYSKHGGKLLDYKNLKPQPFT